MWVLLDREGNTLASFETDQEAYEASYDDVEFPDVYEVAYLGEPW
jgi:hypothetical protein